MQHFERRQQAIPYYASRRRSSLRSGLAGLAALAVLSLGLACSRQQPQVEPRKPKSDSKPAAAVNTANTDRDVKLLEAPRPVQVTPDVPEVPAPATGPMIVRVGLATDLDEIKLPCCDANNFLHLGNEQAVPLTAKIQIAPAGGISQKAVYRLQVAALKDEGQARGIAEYLEESSGLSAEAIFDADTDLYRVRVGRFPDRAGAEKTRDRLAGLGVIEGWVVSEGGKLADPAFTVTIGQQQHRVTGRWLELTANPQHGVRYDRKRYRGRLLIFLNARGRLNLINEIALEDYLRGVVPMEMGPELYNQLEALKAQTVAARTYTLKNLGEFSEEGYDICSTPRCQVYGGMSVEHRLSDQAIRETNGQVVLWQGEPAETFYSATCGGHTENVEVVFPLKKGDYLRGVPCVEAGVTTVAHHGTRGSFPNALVAELLPAAKGQAPRVLAARLEHLALLAGLSVPRDQLRSLDRREVWRFALSLFDLSLDQRLARPAKDLERWIEAPPSGWQAREIAFAKYLLASDLTAKKPQSLSLAEVDEMLFRLALYLGVLAEEQGYFLTKVDGKIQLRQGDRRRTYELPEKPRTYRRRGENLPTEALDLMAGDRLTLYWHRGRIAAMVQPVDAPPLVFGKRAPRSKWRLFKTDQDLAKSVQERYPGFPFTGFEVLSRGVSGRVGKLALLGKDGRRVEVEGLAIRWTLGIYDTLFWAKRHPPQNGKPAGWTFRGRGWGHGVGMSQAGAFGMAVRGSNYREILHHYYSGVELGRLKPSVARPRTPAS